MKAYLTQSQHENLQHRLDNGLATITIAPSVARQFFTHVDNESVEGTAFESVRLKKLTVWAGILVPLFLFVSCLALIVRNFGWGATLAVPLVGIIWTVIAGFGGDRGTWVHTLVGAVVGLGIAALVETNYSAPLALFTISLCLHRLTFEVAQMWVVDLVTRSFPAYDMLVEHIDIKGTSE